MRTAVKEMGWKCSQIYLWLQAMLVSMKQTFQRQLSMKVDIWDLKIFCIDWTIYTYNMVNFLNLEELNSYVVKKFYFSDI